jgi:aminoglycoside phosphotransferase (APT) family kinase protein
MANSLRLLTHIRRAAAGINETTSHAQVQAFLGAADIALNTLQLQASPEFYLEHIAHGQRLLDEGRSLAAASADAVAPTIDLNRGLRAEVFELQILEIRRALSGIVVQLDEREPATKDFLGRMSTWESGFYTHHLEQVPREAGNARTVTRADLQVYLARKFPAWSGLEITKFLPLEGGFSKKTVLFETEDELNGAQALVLRGEQPFDLLCYPGSDVTQEYFMIKLMRECGMPTAEPLWLESDDRHVGCRFIVSRKAEGRVYGGALGSVEALPPELLQSVVSTFVRMHNIKISADNPLAAQSHLKEWLPYRGSLRDTTRFYVEEWLPRLIGLTQIPASPQLQRALKWLQRNMPDSDETPVVLHGDFSFNNLIIGERGVTAVLDWESSRLGDPAEDIIWTQPNIGAYMDMTEFLKIYEAGTGRKISPKRLAYSRVVKCVLNAVACLSAYAGLETRDDVSLNLGVLAYKYMGLFGSQFNSLIESAEQL